MPRRSWLVGGAVLVAVVVVVTAGLIVVAREPPAAAGSTVDSELPASAEPVPSLAVPPVESESATIPGAPLAAVVQAADRAAPAGMTLGAAVLDLSTGELVTGVNGTRQFYSASLAKLIVVVDMLDRRRSDGLAIPESDLELVQRALRGSDDAAMDALWGTYDGPEAIERVAARLGLTGTEAPDDDTQWGETLVTASDFAKLYQHILRDMAPEDRQVITGALATAQRTAADGFDQFFGLLAGGASTTLYAKQGWMTYRPSTQYLHSAGVVHDNRSNTDYAVVLLSIQPSVSTATASARLSTVAKSTLAALGTG